METVSHLAECTNWGANITVVCVTVLAVGLAALTHFEGLMWLSGRFSRTSGPKRRVILYAVLLLIMLHTIEIWIFGLAHHMLLLWPETGKISGAIGLSIFDHVYFSAAVFTTVGFGDLPPVDPIRFLAGTEALTGLVLIGWSASFTYLEIEQLWRPHRERR